jgi:hypothetical protein
MIIPDNLTQFDSNGERIIYYKFKVDPQAEHYYVLHSLFTNFHLKSISGELDFLVLAPGQGIFALEIKHGRVKRENGLWYFTNRFGKTSSSAKGPFRQVSDTMHSIRDYVLRAVEKKPGLYQRYARILFGNGVVFTGEDEQPNFGPEGHTWQVLTRDTLALPISAYIAQLSAGWHGVNKSKNWYDANLSKPTDAECRHILAILRGDFLIDYSPLNQILDGEFLIESFTREQFKLLDFVRFNDRALIEGEAGTGKTLMALELARRSMTDGKRIALFCFNNKLGKRLAGDMDQLAVGSEVAYFAGSLHTFLIKNTDMVVPENPDNQFFVEVLPFEFLLANESIPASEQFDVLIVDEAQDLIHPYYMEVFNVILRNGIKNGKWIFFGDFCNQSIYNKDAESMLASLSGQTSFVKFPPLKINCRNTKRITIHNTLLSGSSPPEFLSSALEGESPTTEFPAVSHVRNRIEILIQALMQKGIPREKIMILSPKSLTNSGLTASDFLHSFIGDDGKAFSTIQSFKGLENTVIILTGFDELLSDDAQRLLYVGISRARLHLYLIFNKTVESQFSTLINKNSAKLQKWTSDKN